MSHEPDPIRLCVPAGIGDISWVYSKVRHLKARSGREVKLYVAGDEPKRGGDFVSLLPDVTFSGYLDRKSFTVATQSLPPDWPPHIGGLGVFLRDEPLNVAANLHLEAGRPLSTFLPMLPTDHHYTITIPEEEEREAAVITDPLPRPMVIVYVSNRAKEEQKAGGWNLWKAHEWARVIAGLVGCPYFRNASFVFLGAEYDRDKTEYVAHMVEEMLAPVNRVVTVIGRPLGTALECLRRAQYFIAYPSGIGIIANVLSIPGVMLLPWLLANLADAYPDPYDVASCSYRAWPNPTPDEVLDWIRHVQLPMLGRDVLPS